MRLAFREFGQKIFSSSPIIATSATTQEDIISLMPSNLHTILGGMQRDANGAISAVWQVR